jgi:glycosyltransferase involved in cell wall biosynthesis
MDYNENNRPFFSVIVPLYNKAPHVNRSISSVLRQTFRQYELIIINDASTDSSLDEVRKFSDPRIKLFQRNEPSPGGYAARNLGMRESRAAWVAFLDADDEWHSRYLELVYEGIRQFPDAGMVSSGWWISMEGNEKKYNEYYIHNKAKGSHLYDIKTYIRGPRPIWTSVAVVQRELLAEIGGFDERWQHGADTDLWLRVLLARNMQALWIPGPGATYHMDSVNRVSARLYQVASPSATSIKNYLKTHPIIAEDLHLQLRQYANKLSMKTFVRKILHDDISIRDIAGTFFFGALSLKRRAYIIFLYLLPVFLRRKVASRIIDRLV